MLLFFQVKPVEQIVAEAKAMAQKASEVRECQEDIDFFALSGGKPKETESHDNHDTLGFEDSFGVSELHLLNSAAIPVITDSFRLRMAIAIALIRLFLTKTIVFHCRNFH